MKLTLISFGFKNGLPPEAHIVMDVRFLKNPYWVESLRDLTGKDAPAGAYIETDPAYAEFMENFKRLLGQYFPLRHCEERSDEAIQQAQGKSIDCFDPKSSRNDDTVGPSPTIAIGCTGGRHRSVYVVEELAAWMRGLNPPITPCVKHRDLG